MALIGFEHFALYGNSTANILLRTGYTLVGSSTNPFPTNSRTGARCMRSASYSGQRLGIIYNLPTAVDVVGQGVAMILEETPASSAVTQGIRFGVSGANGRLRVLPNANLGVSVYLNTTLVGSSANGILTVGSWFWLEAKATSGAGTAGAVEVRLNGNTTPILTVTDLALTAQWTSVWIGAESTAAISNVRYDDWVIWDTSGSDNNDFMGDTFVIVAPPEADTAVADWDASTGTSRFDMIDEDVPSDADYIQADAIGEACEFTHPAFNLGVGSIAAIASQTRAFKSDAGAASYETGIKSAANSSMSGEIALATGPVVHTHISERNPDGGVPWTQSAANAARLRVVRNA